MRSFSIVVASVVLLALAPNCATLPTLDVCGNGLKDPGEDCDGTAGLSKDVHCAGPEQPNACRYTCNVKDPSKACPSGYSCSTVDGVCRTANGTFTAVTPPIAFDADETAIADFDGDGIADVFASQGAAGAIQANVYFSGAGGSVAAQTSVPPVNFGAAALLTGKSAADLVGFLSSPGSAAGMLVMKGDASRSLLPASFSSFPFTEQATFLPLYSANGMLALRGSDLLAFNIEYAPFVDSHLGAPPHLGWGRSGFLGDAFQGALRLGLANAHDVDVYDFDLHPHGKKIMTVTLADPKATIKDFWFSYFDDDPYLDLAIVTDCGGGCYTDRVFVAYGTSSGSTLASRRGGVGTTSPVAADVEFTSAMFGVGVGTILGVQNLFGGPTGEVISQQGISSKASGSWDVVVAFDSLPSEAVTADFNRDGLFDVVLALDGVSEIQYLLNAGGQKFNSATVSLGGVAQHLTVGDFDGDLFPDVAFAEAVDSSTADVGFVFGGLSAQLEGPLEDGPFPPPISQVVANPNILNPGATSSRTDLLAVTGTGASTQLALFPGSANRQLYSPWFFVPRGAGSPLPPMSAAIGAYSAGSNQLATLVGYGAPGGLCLLDSATGTLMEPQGPVALPKEVDPTSAALVTIPGKSGAADQVAVVSSTSGMTPKGVLALAGVVGSGFAFPDGATVEFTPPPYLFEVSGGIVTGGFGPIMPLGPSVPRLPACAADLDGDGTADLAFIGEHGEHARSLLVAWDPADGVVAPTTPDVKTSPDWLACVRTGSGTALAVLESGKIRLVQCGGTSGRSCEVGPVVATAGEGSVYLSGAPPPTIVAGDVTGDGLDDLVVTGFNQTIQIFAAQPTLP